MSFLNPVFLGALICVAIPLLIHLIRRRRLKIVRWAAMDFLKQSQRSQRKRLRIEELILLAIRMLIVALAVMAFARPVLRALGVPLLSQNARVYAVIVLDNSFSMDHRGADGKSSFERARDAADSILTQILKPGDSASLVLLSDKPEAAVGAPSFDLNLVRERMRSAKVSDRRTDYLAGARMTAALLKASKAPVKEVYWLTDDQANAWNLSKKESARQAWGDVGAQCRVTWISVGAPADSRDNLSVETPTLGRELVTPHVPARIEARILNRGGKARSSLLVNLVVDGKQVGTTQIAVPANDAATARFVYRFEKPGTHTGQIVLGDPQRADNLAHDNSAPFVVRVRDRIQVLVQDVHPANDPNRSESFYLLTAMAPGGMPESFAPKLREGEGLGSLNLRDYDVVVIAGASGISEGDRRILGDYVKAGGGLLIFPGAATDSRRLNADFQAAGLLPATLKARRTLPDENALTLNPASITHPVLSLFKDTDSLNLGLARFATYYPLEPVSDGADTNAVRVMVRFSNGDPAFVERKVGLGRVIIAASSAGATWNQLPLKVSYVPLVYQLASYLGQGPVSHRNLALDEPVFLTLPLSEANRAVRITTPDGRTVSQNSVLEARGVTFTYAATNRSGLYRVSVPGTTTDDAFAVGLPSDESDLTAIDPSATLTQVGLPGSRLTVASRVGDLEASVRQSRYGVEVWRPFVFAVLALMFLESLLAQLFGRRG